MAQNVTITTSTAAAVTGVLVLNPVAKSTTVTLTSTTAAGSSNATVQLEFSLDDPSFFPIGGSTTSVWGLLSSATAMAASAAVSPALSYTVLTPIAQVRINSTSGSTGTTYSFRLDALQAVTA